MSNPARDRESERPLKGLWRRAFVVGSVTLMLLPTLEAHAVTSSGRAVSPEHPVSNPVYERADWWQQSSRVVWNGSQYLAVWQDHRLGSNDTFATTISAGGVALDSSWIAA